MKVNKCSQGKVSDWDKMPLKFHLRKKEFNFSECLAANTMCIQPEDGEIYLIYFVFVQPFLIVHII